MSVNKVTVNINGNEYIMVGEESEEEMLKIASYVDKRIKDIASRNTKLNLTYASVLSALNITNELFKLRKEYQEFRTISQDPVRQLSELKIEYNNLIKVNARLEEQLSKSAENSEKGNHELIDMKRKYEDIYNDYTNRNEELSKAYRDNEIVRREKENKQKELERAKIELSESKHKLLDLQNQLLQNQIDLVKIKNEFDEFKLSYTRGGERTKL